MPHRSYDHDENLHGRDDDYRAERQPRRGPSRYRGEGRSWDDDRSSSYSQGGYSSADYSGYASASSRPDYREHSGYRTRPYEPRPFTGDREGYRSRPMSDADYDAEPHGRAYMGSGRSSFGGDYGQGGHGGFGSGGYDGASQTGGSAGYTGSRPTPYADRSSGYAPGAQIWDGPGQDVASDHRSRGHDFEPDYLHWRDGQMRDLDRDYHAWRDERRQKFSKDFDDWRSQRRAQGVRSQDQTAGHYGTPGASSDGDTGGTLQTNSQVNKVSGAEESSRKKN